MVGCFTLVCFISRVFMVHSANIESGMFQTISMDLLWVFNNPQIVAFLLLWKFTVPVPLLKLPAPSLFHIAVFFFFPVWKFIEPVPASSEAPNFPLHPHLCCISELQPVFDNCEQGEKQTDKKLFLNIWEKCSVPLFYLSLYSVEQLHEFLSSWGGGGRLIRGWNCGRWEEALFMGLGLVTLCQWNLLKMKAIWWSC